VCILAIIYLLGKLCGVGSMEITYRNKKLEKVCTDYGRAKRAYGQEVATKIHQRVAQITAAPDAETMVKFHIGRCHSLHGDRRGQYALDLVHPLRLVFEEHNQKLVVAEIVEIVNYH